MKDIVLLSELFASKAGLVPIKPLGGSVFLTPAEGISVLSQGERTKVISPYWIMISGYRPVKYSMPQVLV